MNAQVFPPKMIMSKALKSSWAFGLSLLLAYPAFGQNPSPVPQPLPPGTVKPVLPPPHLQGPRPQRQMPELPVVQKIGPGLFAIGEVRLNKAAKSISFPAVVNMNKGMLEYILVRNGGKTHESLFRTTVDPLQVHYAMLLIGSEGTDQPLARQGDPETPKGNPVDIAVSYIKDGRMTTYRPESWVVKKVDDKMVDAGPLQWVYTGSTFSNGRFLAQAEGSVIAIFHDPAALFDNASPGGESDRVWFANDAAAPPVGTPVTLTINVKN